VPLLKRLFQPKAPSTDVVSINDGNFEAEVLASPVPVLLDAWNEDCGPCPRLAPVMVEMARHYRGRLKIAELDTQRAPLTTARLGISAAPTVIYFHRQREVQRVVGLKSPLHHRDYIDSTLLPEVEGSTPVGH
jgi:thioredoxin 1